MHRSVKIVKFNEVLLSSCQIKSLLTSLVQKCMLNQHFAMVIFHPWKEEKKQSIITLKTCSKVIEPVLIQRKAFLVAPILLTKSRARALKGQCMRVILNEGWNCLLPKINHFALPKFDEKHVYQEQNCSHF